MLADSCRRQVINIERDIVENGDSYDFYQAVKLLNRLALVSNEPSTVSDTAKLRIQPELNLDYPQSDIAEISRDEASGSFRIITTFFGLYGVSSPLPGFYTEELLDDEWDEFSGRKDFFDVIHNHIYPLLYAAWLKYKFSHNLVEFEQQKYGEIIFSLIGLSDAYRLEGRHYGYLLKYSGLLSQRNRSLLGLKTLLQDLLGDIGLDISPCIERKVTIVNKQRCRLGKQNAMLGVDACIGTEVADRGGKFDIDIGPLDVSQFDDFCQGNETVRTIETLLRFYLTQPLEYRISLLLQAGTVSPACIGKRQNSVLGRNCWLTSRPNETMERVSLNNAMV